MSTYVMSDLHGNYNAYEKMLEKIALTPEDTLYILGDILDRGPEPVKIILDLMKRSNVNVIAGNHCVMACECFAVLLKEITEESLAEFDNYTLETLLNWQLNGGVTTIEELKKYDRYTQRAVFDFISGFDLYDEIEVGGKSFLLVHGGLGNFDKQKEMWEYELDELVWTRPDYSEKYFEDKITVTGHTPTQNIEENPRPGYIYKANNHIAIDCGVNRIGGRLGCIRLDDMEEYYVEGEA